MSYKDVQNLVESYLSIYNEALNPKIAIRIDRAKGDRVAYSPEFLKDLKNNKNKRQEIAMIEKWIADWEAAKGVGIFKFEPKSRTFVRELNIGSDAANLISKNIDLNREARMLYVVEVQTRQPSVHIMAIVMPADTSKTKPETEDQSQETDIENIDMEPWKKFQRKRGQQSEPQPEEQTPENEPAHTIVFCRAWFTYDEYNPDVKRKLKHQTGINSYTKA